MADNPENILVEFDYNNIAVIDPNKVIDDKGRARERLVRHEDFVIYANLECKVLPRTKLLVGASNADNLRTISVSDMNFLNPGFKNYLDTAYTDELTGKDTLKGEGVNQQKIGRVYSTKKPDQFYYAQSTSSGKEPKATDNGLLGIESIQIKQGLDFEPVVTIRLKDIKGRALFESGNDSPYAAFFNLPYPLFYLTIKGYYGKAVRLPLMLQDFSCTYDGKSGNYDVDLIMFTYKYSVLAEVNFASMLATPHMYASDVTITPKKVGNAQTQNTKLEVVEYGYQKIKEVYSEYKSKGLLPKDFPELTIPQLKNNLDTFIQDVLDTYIKQNLDPLTKMIEYEDILNEYRGKVYTFSDTSWFDKYMDKKNFFVLNDKTKIFTYKPEASGGTETYENELKNLINDFNSKLNNNETLGQNGQYEINGEVKRQTVPVTITFDIFKIKNAINESDINYIETIRAISGTTAQITNDDITSYQARFRTINTTAVENTTVNGNNITTYRYYKFEGPGSFSDLLDQMFKKVDTLKNEIEESLTNGIANLIKDKNSKLGFIPTIRNALAVVFANGEAFVRLLDEVHTKAWNKCNSPIRKAPVFDVSTKAANPDASNEDDKARVPVYPWPSFIIETTGENGEEKYQPKYPGDADIIKKTRADLLDEWPEVEFVEEYVRGLTVKQNVPSSAGSANEVRESRRVSVNAVEYPTSNDVYNNKEETKFFFEIYERLILASFYSKMNRTTTSTNDLGIIANAIAEAEKLNVKEGLGLESPYIKEKLSKYGFNSTNFLLLLRQFSNQGVGESWQNFIRGIFNTNYIKNLTQNSNSISYLNYNPIEVLSQKTNGSNVSTLVSFDGEEDVSKYITGSSTSKKYDLTDFYPFIDESWCIKNLAGSNTTPPQVVGFTNPVNPAFSSSEFFQTNKNLFYNSVFKTITNFSNPNLENFIDTLPKPISNYNYTKIQTPTTAIQNSQQPEYNLNFLDNFYNNRFYNYLAQLPTEGKLNYSSKPGLLTSTQTVSMLNTPFFVNSIQEGVKRFRNFDPYPYRLAAYLFINSLPLATLREKFTKITKSTPPNSSQEVITVENMNYIFATLKKFGAIHRLPFVWILKIGSIWHRYKTWAETGVDMLDDCWKGFNYLENYDPITSASTTDYALFLDNGQNVDIILEKNSQIGVESYSQINTGFYPQLINDFNVFYQGYRLFTGYTSSEIQSGITLGLRTVSAPESNYTMPFSGDAKNPKRLIQINGYSTYVLTSNKKECFILPSHGALLNQVTSECFEQNKLKFEVTGNTSIYNGSVRSFWSAPTYGYFDVNRIVKPAPDEYMKKVFGGFAQQENYSIGNSTSGYTKISEIFSVFEKDVLDLFEEKFLDFSRDKYSYLETNPEAGFTETLLNNFHLFFCDLMRLNAPPTGVTNTEIVQNLTNAQNLNFTMRFSNLMNYDVLFRYGNPSNFNKNLFYTFSNKDLQDKIVFESYAAITPNALPNGSNGQTLVQSKVTYPDAWKALIQYVGFSEIPKIVYSNNGSYIFDFFIDFDIAFTADNIKICSPIIKMYATQKYKNKTMNESNFRLTMDEYIDKGISFINKTLDNLFIKLGKELDTVSISQQKKIIPFLESKQSKLELYETFKATNDKWISGNDYKSKTLYEDVLFLDRASRNIGDKAVCDVYKLRLAIDPEKINLTANMMDIVKTILSDNNFTVMNIPAYVNFYGVQDAAKNAIPKPEGSLELANTLFGTFTNVDYKNSSTKMVCFYGGKPSVQLDTQGVVQGFKDDSFDMRRAENPLVENQVGKKDFAQSNKVVGFNVDIGPQNQGVFQSFSVSQKNSTPTAESLDMISQVASQAGNRGFASQSLSLYNLYKLRSYKCDVSMFGNALIQPLMYFNLRYVPMFSGPYMITEVSHSISPGQFTTSFSGVRQPLANLSLQLDFLQSLKDNLVKKIIEAKKQELAEAKKKKATILANKNNLVQNATQQTIPNTATECSATSVYNDYTKIPNNPVVNSVSAANMKTQIEATINDPALNIPGNVKDKVKYAVFAKIFIESATQNNFKAYENNFMGASLNFNWYNLETYFAPTKQYFCVNKGQDRVLPYVVFEDELKVIQLLVEKYRYLTFQLKDNFTDEELAIFVTTENYDTSLWDAIDPADKSIIIAKVTQSRTTYNSIP